MKLKQIVCDSTDLTLTKEKKVIKYGEVFEVSDERGKEILAVKFKGHPVAEEVKQPVKKAAKKKDSVKTNLEPL